MYTSKENRNKFSVNHEMKRSKLETTEYTFDFLNRSLLRNYTQGGGGATIIANVYEIIK